MSIYLRDTANDQPDKALSSFHHNKLDSQQYLRENLGSEDRMLDASSANKRGSSTGISTAGPPKRGKDSNGREIVTWPEQYRRARRQLNQSPAGKAASQKEACKTEEEQLESREKSSLLPPRLEISQNQTQELEKPLEEEKPLGEVVQPHPIFQQSVISAGLDEPVEVDDIGIDVSPIEAAPDRPRNPVEEAYERAVRESRQSQSESSENIFDVFKKNARAVESEEERGSKQSSNIFDTFKRRSRRQPESNHSSSDSDADNIFEKKNVVAANLLRSSAEKKRSLEEMLLATPLYEQYKRRAERKYLKKISLDIPELKETRKKSKIPKDLYFKPDRVQFKKTTMSEAFADASYAHHFYLTRVTADRTALYFQDLRSEQLKNLNGVECARIRFPKEECISPHSEYDPINQRFYLFSNADQKVLVYSEQSAELLCKIPVQKHITDPNMHFSHIHGRSFLILIGGYTRVEKQVAQGNNTIEIFEVNKWFLNLKSRIIKLIIGRINPIFITSKLRNDHRFLILGGNAIARLDAHGAFDFEYEKDINESTNLTGVSISSKEITELFDYEEHTNISNVSVKLSDPFCLHSGIVLTLSNSFLLALPTSLNLFQIKIFHKEVNIIEARGSVFFNRVEQYQKRELSLKVEREKLIIYSIDDRGIFHISSQEGNKTEKCRCSLY